MAQALVPLQNITLGSNQANVTFASIPNTYQDLYLVFNGGTNTGEADMLIRYNSDTGSNYSSVYMFGNGSSLVSGSASGTSSLIGYLGTGLIVNTINIFDYAQAKHKTLVSRCATSTIASFAHSSRWASTSAITSVQVLLSANSFAIGSTFALYGVA